MPDGSKRCEECVCYWVCESPPDSTECKQALEMVESKISSHNTSSPKLPDKAKVVDAADGIFPYRHLRIDELTVLSWTYEVMAGKIGL